MKKIIASIMVVVMLLCMFSVTAGAAKMTKEEVVDFYHSILEKTAKKYKVIYINDAWKSRETADFSPLSGKDLEKTMEEYDYCDGEWYSFSEGVYLQGVCKKGNNVKETALYYWFEINDFVDYYYTLKSAKYEDNKITINLSYSPDKEITETKKIVAELTDKNQIKKITISSKDVFKEYSVKENIPFKTTHEFVEVYTFVYDKIPAKSLELSTYDIVMGYRDTAEITYKVGPENATYKGVYIETLSYDSETEEWTESLNSVYSWEEDGKIYVEVAAEGEFILNVRTYSGDILKTCYITAEFDFFDRISYLFDNMLTYLQYFFDFVLPGIVI